MNNAGAKKFAQQYRLTEGIKKIRILLRNSISKQ
jgi:hypothetical protein